MEKQAKFLSMFLVSSTKIVRGEEPPKLKIIASGFPIGGFDISTLFPLSTSSHPDWKTIIDSMKYLGFNTYYQADYQGGNALTLASHLDGTMSVYLGNHYYGKKDYVNNVDSYEGRYDFQDHYIGGWREGMKSVEQRYFLASFQTGKLDIERMELNRSPSDWKITRGSLATTTSTEIQEWKIPINNPGTGSPWVGDLLNLELPDVTSTMFIDFVFRFETDNPSALGTGILYNIIIEFYNDQNTLITGSTVTFELKGEDYYSNKNKIEHQNNWF